MQELDSLQYAAKTMQESDSMQCDRARVRKRTGEGLEVACHLSRSVTPDRFPYSIKIPRSGRPK